MKVFISSLFAIITLSSIQAQITSYPLIIEGESTLLDYQRLRISGPPAELIYKYFDLYSEEKDYEEIGYTVKTGAYYSCSRNKAKTPEQTDRYECLFGLTVYGAQYHGTFMPFPKH